MLELVILYSKFLELFFPKKMLPSAKSCLPFEDSNKTSKKCFFLILINFIIKIKFIENHATFYYYHQN